MVHNGIEYIDMQLIGEAYWLLVNLLGMKPPELSKVFSQWNQGDLDSYLIQITADILQQKDPLHPDGYFVDYVLDAAGQKGTGKWTSTNALDMGIPANAIAEAVFARCLSALKEERVGASKTLKGPDPAYKGNRDELVAAVRDALYCSKICAYAQGFQLMREGQKEYKWKLNFAEIASIWRGGCIIRARFLQKITDAYSRNADLVNLLLDPYFSDQIAKSQANWRKVVAPLGQQRHRRPGVHERPGLLRRLPQRPPSRQSAAGPARLFRRSHLRTRRRPARKILPPRLARTQTAPDRYSAGQRWGTLIG